MYPERKRASTYSTPTIATIDDSMPLRFSVSLGQKKQVQIQHPVPRATSYDTPRVESTKINGTNPPFASSLRRHGLTSVEAAKKNGTPSQGLLVSRLMEARSPRIVAFNPFFGFLGAPTNIDKTEKSWYPYSNLDWRT